MSTPMPASPGMPNVWSPLFYNITKKIFSSFYPPSVSQVNIDCIVNTLVSTFPNPNNSFKDPKKFAEILSNCSQNPTQTFPPFTFDTNIGSSWNKLLISNLRGILPYTFNTPSNLSNLDLDCLVNSFIKKFPNPNDLVDYIVKTQNDSPSNAKPDIPFDLISYCDLQPIKKQPIKKRRNNKYLIMVAVALLIAGIIAFFMWKRTTQNRLQIQI